MMRTGLPMTKPAIAAAVPVNEFRRLMTTGMSAPPIGRTIVTPKMRPAATTTPRSASVTCRVERDRAGRAEDQHDRPEAATRAMTMVTIRPPGT